MIDRDFPQAPPRRMRLAELEAENRRLREQLEELKRGALYNEEVSQRFNKRELELLAADSLPSLLGTLTDGLERSFQVDELGVVIVDPDYDIRRLITHTRLGAEDGSRVRFVEDIRELSPVYRRLTGPWLGPWVPYEHGELFARSDLRSVALLPMERGGRLIGSLNLGSRDPERFTRSHASDFLARLTTIAAVCLENAANRERLVLSSLTDALTGLYNRRYLTRRLEEEIARAQRYAQPLSCLFIDVDHFKRINDTYGHAAGDEVLRELGGRLRGHLRPSDVAVRFGGEEFALLLPQTAAREAVRIAERMRTMVSAEPVRTRGGQIPVTVSIGVAQARPELGQRRETVGSALLAAADAALYQAKEKGRDCVVLDRGGSEPRHGESLELPLA
jgi:diguanylate cyclase (GGDEF)-like protein